MCGSERQLWLESDSKSPRWFIITVQPGYEVSVQRSLESLLAIPVLVPYRTEIRQWADRKVIKRRALLPGYVIAQTDPEARGQVVRLPRVNQFLRFGGEPMWLQDHEVESLRRISERTVDPESWEQLETGTKVRILSGPLTGCSGEVVARNASHYFTVRLAILGRQIATRVDLCETELSLLPDSEIR
jgi:transcription antitermination factor NusG